MFLVVRLRDEEEEIKLGTNMEGHESPCKQAAFSSPSSCPEKQRIPSRYGGQVSLFPAQLSRCFFQSSCWHSALTWITLWLRVAAKGVVRGFFTSRTLWIESSRASTRTCSSLDWKRPRVPQKKVQEALGLMSCNLENRDIIHYVYIYT